LSSSPLFNSSCSRVGELAKKPLTEEFGRLIKKSYYFSVLAPDKRVTTQDQKQDFIRQAREQQIFCSAQEHLGDLFYEPAQFTKAGRTLIFLDEIT